MVPFVNKWYTSTRILIILLFLHNIFYCQSEINNTISENSWCQDHIDCNYYGICINDRKECSCYSPYDGINCSKCELGYFSYPSCYECSLCEQNNGICDHAMDTCICSDPSRFRGLFCDLCQDHHYGANCTNAPILLQNYPNTIVDIDARDGVDIVVTGDNFNVTDITAVICRFEDLSNWTVKATKANSTTIVCRLSNYTGDSSRYLYISISLDGGNIWIDKIDWNILYVYIHSDCGQLICEFGYCSYGSCICYEGFEGTTCNQCSDGYFFSPSRWCVSCANECLNNGTCINQTCVCREGFTNYRCDRCAEHYYGIDCLKQTIFLDIYPNTIIDIAARDGINITINGDNFNTTNISTVLCRFEGTNIVDIPAVYVNSTSIICPLFNYSSQSIVYVSISLNGGQTWSQITSSYIIIQSDCGDKQCVHGYCSYGSCLCTVEGFTGAICNECDDGFFRPSNSDMCYNCSTNCQNNGICTNYTCVCQENFAAPFCDTCAINFFGPECLPFPKIDSISPNVLNDIGGFNINVFGVNFSPEGNRQETYCKFTSYTNGYSVFFTKALVLNDSMCTCSVPVNTLQMSWIWHLDIVANQTLDSYSIFTLQVRGTCPNFTNCEPHGYCQFGKCVCTSPYYGLSCETLISPPILDNLPIFTVKEFSSTVINMSSFVNSGTPPFRYALSNVGDSYSMIFYYNCLSLNEESGLLNISKAVASTQNYNFTIFVSNIEFTTASLLIIQVIPSYNATVFWRNSRQYIPVGSINSLEYFGNSTIPNVAVTIWINGAIYQQLESDDKGYFSGYYSLGSEDELHIAVSHPSQTLQPSSQDVVYVGSLRIILPNWINEIYTGYPANLTNFVTIENRVDFNFKNLTIDIIHSSSCVKDYHIWPSFIENLSASSKITVSLSILSNCSFLYELMNFTVNDPQLSSLVSTTFLLSSKWSCRTRNECNSYGSCINNETCLCTDSYSGDSCEQCGPNRFQYPSCMTCPQCVRGQAICNNTVALCDCGDNTRIYGALCEYCHSGYYGENCLKIPTLATLLPSSGLETSNNTLVTLIGDNFQNVSSFCIIIGENGTKSIPAIFISSTQMTCLFPPHKAEIVNVQLSLNNSIVYSQNSLFYEYLASCPQEGCGQGSCVLGSCRCSYPYYGVYCSLFPNPPNLTTIPNFTINELSSFVLDLTKYLIQGNKTSLQWFLNESSNANLSINASTGLLTWPSIVALSTDYSITVNAYQTSTGINSQKKFNIHVDLEYNVTVQFQKSHQILSQQTIIQINGIINNKTNSLKNRTVKVWVMMNNIRRYLSTIVILGTSNRFTTYYTPLSTEYGTLFVGAEHPADKSNIGSQDYVTLLGLNVQTLNVGTLNAKAGENFTNIFVSFGLLSNPCESTIMNLTSSVISPLGVVSFFNFTSPNCSLTNITPLTTCLIDLSIRFATSGSGILTFEWIAQAIQPVTLSIPINVVYDKPEFTLSPSSKNLIVPRNSQQLLVITVSNTGSSTIGPLSVLLPNQTYVSVLTPNISMLNPSTNATITLGIAISESAPLNTFSIQGLIVDRNRSLSRPFNIELTIVGSNDTLFDFNIICQDELSYFGSNTKNLANVSITITNDQLNVRHVLKSNETGQASVSLVAGVYEITANALKHSSYRELVTIDRATVSSSGFTIFLQRIFVSYTFKVTEVSIEQTYDIALDAQFQTYVPAPVLTMSPAMIDLDELEANENITQIDFTVTNHGLIRVTDAQFKLPTAHPYLRFNIEQLPLGNIEANSSIIITVTVKRNGTTRRRRDSIASMIGDFSASYICGIIRKIDLKIPIFTHKIISPPLTGGQPIGGGGNMWIFTGVPDDIEVAADYFEKNIPPVSLSCENVVKILLEKGAGKLKGLPGIINTCGGMGITMVLKHIGPTVSEMLDCVQSLGFGKASTRRRRRSVTETENSYKNLNELSTTIKSSTRKKRSSWDENADISVARLSYMIDAIVNYEELITLTYGNKIWINTTCVDDSWQDAFVRAQGQTSDMENLISEQEYNDLMLVPNRCVNPNATSEYILYRNRTIYYSSQNITESNNVTGISLPYMSVSEYLNRSSQYQKDLNYTRLLGYSNIIDAYKNVYQHFVDTYSDSPIGVCAKVTIRIIQNIAITRQAFDAELIIDNSGTDILSDIQIILEIRNENQTNATDRFSIGAPNTIGDINNGSLSAGGTGQFNWLIIPYQSAAPIFSTWYSVGGHLSYTISGQLVKITLTPDQIQVTPGARLDIAYFLEQQIIGPDPFTREIIAPQPFILAIIITNSGYGSANNFRISSGQPEIIENEKGLLINFTIVGMNVNGQERTDLGLSALLGDVKSFSSSIVTWHMIASLRGYFRKFNASYTESNPNGDSKLSLINSITTYRLQHTVSLDILFHNLSDSKMDYLVNQPNGMETVHTSTNATISFPVATVRGTTQYIVIDENTYKLVITAEVPVSSFIHISVNNSYPQTTITSSKRMINNFDIKINTWLTHTVDHLGIQGDRVEDLLHIFDWSLSSNLVYEIILQITSDIETTSSQPMVTTDLTTPSDVTSDIITENSSSTNFDTDILSTDTISILSNFTSTLNVTMDSSTVISDTVSILTTIFPDYEMNDTTIVPSTDDIIDITDIIPTVDIITVSTTDDTNDITVVSPTDDKNDITAVSTTDDTNDITAVSPTDDKSDITAVSTTDDTNDITVVSTTDDKNDITAASTTDDTIDASIVPITSDITDTITVADTDTTAKLTNIPSDEATTLKSTTDLEPFSSVNIGDTTYFSTNTPIVSFETSSITTTNLQPMATNLKSTSSVVIDDTTTGLQPTATLTTISTDVTTHLNIVTDSEKTSSTITDATTQFITHAETTLTTSSTTTLTESTTESTLTTTATTETTMTTITPSTTSSSSSSIISLSATVSSTSMITSSIASTSTIKSSGTTSLTTATTTYTASLISKSYIEFVLVIILNFQMILADLINQLLFIFIGALRIPSNQIKMSSTPFINIHKRSINNYEAYVQLYSTNFETAESLLTRIKQQLADEKSEIRKYNITADLNPNSIKNINTWYICIDQTIQQTRCSQNITLIPLCEANVVSTKLNIELSQGFSLTPIWILCIMEILLICYYKLYWI